MNAREAVRRLRVDEAGEKLTEARLKRVREQQDSVLLKDGSKLVFSRRFGWLVYGYESRYFR